MEEHTSHNKHEHEEHEHNKHEHEDDKIHHAHHLGKTKTKPNLWKGVSIVLGVLVIFLIFGKSDTQPDNSPKEQLIIEEYSDFQCSYCKRVVPTVKQLEELYGDKIRFEYKHFPLGFHKDAQKASEASECARDQDKFWEYHDKLFANQQVLDISSLKKYAKELGLDSITFDSCLDNGDKAELVKSQMLEGQSKGVTGTPAFIINGELISGAQPIESFIPIIEKALGEKSDGLDKLYGDEPEVELIIITEKDCADCDTTQIVEVTRKLFPRLAMEEIDVNSVGGKKLVRTYNLEKIPSYLFNSNIINTKEFKQNNDIQGSFEKTGEGYKLKDEVTGAVTFIDPVKRAAYEARLAEEEKLAKERLGMKGDKPQIDFFVMSYCPYGNQAEEAIEKVYQELKDKAVFQPRYVIYSNYRGGGPKYCLDKESKYCSMHGIQELNQNIRERCVYEDMGTKEFFEFTLAMNKKCNAQNADGCWEGVAKELGLDTEKIAKCERERGIEFAKGDKELNDLLKVQGSPTLFIDGQAYNGARTPEGYLSALCAAFDKKPSECDGTPEPVMQEAVPAGGCG